LATVGFGFTSYGAGASWCAIEGQTARPGDATPVGGDHFQRICPKGHEWLEHRGEAPSS
jgi:hypothetical protein